MDIQIETQNVDIPPHATTRLRSRIKKAMNKTGLQIARLHLSLREVTGKRGRREKVCTVRATLETGGEVVVIDRSGKMRESLFRALRRSRTVIRRELVRRRQRERKIRFSAQAALAN